MYLLKPEFWAWFDSLPKEQREYYNQINLSEFDYIHFYAPPNPTDIGGRITYIEFERKES